MLYIVASYTENTGLKGSSYIIYVMVIPWARVVCLICTPEAQGPAALGLQVYISGKP